MTMNGGAPRVRRRENYGDVTEPFKLNYGWDWFAGGMLSILVVPALGKALQGWVSSYVGV